jgi:hypothetical protein
MIWVLILAIMGAAMPTSRRCDDGEMLPLLKRHEIQVLLKAGFTVGDVAERSGTSVDTVRGFDARTRSITRTIPLLGVSVG